VLTFGDTRRIFLARQATDTRKGCASLAAVVENALGWEDIDLDAVDPGSREARPVAHVCPHSGWVPKDGEARDSAPGRPARSRGCKSPTLKM